MTLDFAIGAALLVGGGIGAWRGSAGAARALGRGVLATVGGVGTIYVLLAALPRDGLGPIPAVAVAVFFTLQIGLWIWMRRGVRGPGAGRLTTTDRLLGALLGAFHVIVFVVGIAFLALAGFVATLGDTV